MKLANYSDIIDGTVFRVPKAYPVYDADYTDHLDILQRYVIELENFQTIGRNGLFRYNNMDHSMLTGIYAVDNLFEKIQRDIWDINEEQEYFE